MNGWDMNQNGAQSNHKYVVGLRSSVSTSVHQEGETRNIRLYRELIKPFAFSAIPKIKKHSGFSQRYS